MNEDAVTFDMLEFHMLELAAPDELDDIDPGWKTTPAEGVIARDARSRGPASAYIVGASVFPTVGYANPTHTIVALAARLADHFLRPDARVEVKHAS